MSLRRKASPALWGVLIVVALWLGTVLWDSRGTPPEVVFLAVGQGDCLLIRDRNQTLMVDVGPTSEDFDAGERIVLPELRRLGVSSIDVIVLTHPDSDHTGGLAAIMRRFPNAQVLASNAFRKHPDLLARYESAGVKEPGWLGEHARLTVGRWQVQLWCPPWREGMDDNDGSVMLKGVAPGISLVATGDASVEVESAALLQKMDWRADILKAGHHGSAGSTSEAWLAAVQPKWVVFSCGRENRYGHPSPETVARVEAAMAKVRRTDREGALQFWGQP